MQYACASMTGIRPTGSMTVGNLIGAILPSVEQQAMQQSVDEGPGEVLLFSADLHATTTADSRKVPERSIELGRMLMAAGAEGPLFAQRDLMSQVLEAQMMLNGLMTLAQVRRTPAIKGAISGDQELVGLDLLGYPTMMAADIILQRPQFVPTGQDQLPHLEVTRKLIRAFNETYGSSLPVPSPRLVSVPNVLSLADPTKKMSKSVPAGAIFLSDDPENGRRKIMKAISPSHEDESLRLVTGNFLLLAKSLATPRHSDVLADIQANTEGVTNGEPVMGKLKAGVGIIVADFLSGLAARAACISDADVILRYSEGKETAITNTDGTLQAMRSVYWGGVCNE